MARPSDSGDAAGWGSLAAMLRRHRKQALLSQEQLAERSGLSTRTIRDLEHGRTRSPHGLSVRLLVDALGLGGPERAAFEAAARADCLDVGAADAEPDDRSSSSSGAQPNEQSGSLLRPPAHLPADLPDFTGRDAVGVRLQRLLNREPAGEDPAAGNQAVYVPMVLITGPGGVGKTAFAVHVAHRLRRRFVDGQLYVNLRGAEATSLDPADVLAGFLHALGLQGAGVPASLDERSAVFRTTVADRRVLVLLDNAADEAQVRPLLPGGAGCGVLITSRGSLAGLEGGQRISLDVMSADEATELLARITGPLRVAAEPSAAADIVRYCGYLPLALRVAGARLLTRPHLPLQRLAALLSDEHRRLDRLRVGDLEVRSSIAFSERGLGADDRRAFLLLGVLDAPDLPGWVAAAVLGRPAEVGEEVVERLVEAQLLNPVWQSSSGNTRFQFHDLIRIYAREQADRHLTEQEQRDALARALQQWLDMAVDAALRLPGRLLLLADRADSDLRLDPSAIAVSSFDPTEWFERERSALVASVLQSHAAGLDTFAYRLALTLTWFLKLRGHFYDWTRAHTTALASARWAGDLRAEAALLYALGEMHLDQDYYDLAAMRLKKALLVLRGLHDPGLGSRVLCSLAVVRQRQGDLVQARSLLEESLRLAGEAHDEHATAEVLHALGAVHREQGDIVQAVRCYERSLTGFDLAGDRFNQAVALCSLGVAYRLDGDDRTAERCLRTSLRLCRELGHSAMEAFGLRYLGDIHLDRGEVVRARSLIAKSLDLCRQQHERYGEALALSGLGAVHLADRQFETALTVLRRALDIWEDLQVPLLRARTLITFGDVLVGLGAPSLAGAAWRDALREFERIDAPEVGLVTGRLDGVHS